MSAQQMSGPDPSKPVPSATAMPREQPEDISFESDFADLAARFAAESGGGLTPELSADLALEIVLNEIVEQACRITGATGAAIVLERDGEMVCRASSGTTAPQLGSPIDTQAGLAGECLRTRRTQCCNDALSDHRADAEASQRVGVRSVVVMPLLRGDEAIGLFELFSTQPFAFGVRDERALEALVDRTLENLHRALHPFEPEPEPTIPQLTETPYVEPSPDDRDKPVVPSSEISPKAPVQAASKELDLVVWFLGIAVVAAAVLLGVALGRHLGTSQAESQRAIPLGPETEARGVTNPAKTETGTVQQKPADARPKASSPPRPSNRAGVPPGGLLVFENGKEVFRMAPAEHPDVAADGKGSVRLASEIYPEKVEVPEEMAVRELVDRVEPEYPDAARQQAIQGAVVLDVHIGVDGTVQDARVVSGEPILAKASTDAVKQWKFKPHTANDRPAEMQTRITLNFRLHQ